MVYLRRQVETPIVFKCYYPYARGLSSIQLKHQYDRLKGAIMLKPLYILVWILVALLIVSSFLGGYFNTVTQIALSVVVLGLVYALALWSVLTNNGKLEIFSRNQAYFKGGMR